MLDLYNRPDYQGVPFQVPPGPLLNLPALYNDRIQSLTSTGISYLYAEPNSKGPWVRLFGDVSIDWWLEAGINLSISSARNQE